VDWVLDPEKANQLHHVAECCNDSSGLAIVLLNLVRSKLVTMSAIMGHVQLSIMDHVIQIGKEQNPTKDGRTW
jgi:hypothetical protein